MSKELVYPSEGLIVMPSSYADMAIKKKVFTKDEVITILTELQQEINEEKANTENLHYDDLENAESYNVGIDNSIDTIQERIDKLKEE